MLENYFYFIDNSCIAQDRLYKYRLHLQESVKIILARNFTYFVDYASRDINSEFSNLKSLGTLDVTDKGVNDNHINSCV